MFMLLFLLLDIVYARGPSFNCKVRTAPDQAIVCGDNELSDLDLKMARAYKIYLADFELTDAQRADVKSAQRLWIESRTNCAANSDLSHSDRKHQARECIRAVYEDRLNQLFADALKLTPTDSADNPSTQLSLLAPQCSRPITADNWKGSKKNLAYVLRYPVGEPFEFSTQPSSTYFRLADTSPPDGLGRTWSLIGRADGSVSSSDCLRQWSEGETSSEKVAINGINFVYERYKTSGPRAHLESRAVYRTYNYGACHQFEVVASMNSGSDCGRDETFLRSTQTLLREVVSHVEFVKRKANEAAEPKRELENQQVDLEEFRFTAPGDIEAEKGEFAGADGLKYLRTEQVGLDRRPTALGIFIQTIDSPAAAAAKSAAANSKLPIMQTTLGGQLAYQVGHPPAPTSLFFDHKKEASEIQLNHLTPKEFDLLKSTFNFKN